MESNLVEYQRSVRRPWWIVFLLILLCLAGLQLAGRMDWGLGDFVFAAVVLFGGFGAYRAIAGRGQGRLFQVAVALSLLSALSMIWLMLAVGIIGSEDSQANIMYVGVLGIGLLGSLVARFRASGMSMTMAVVTIAQLVVTVIGVTLWKPAVEEHVFSALGLNLIYLVLFGTSAILFRRASRYQQA